MPRFFRRGRTKVRFVPTIAATTLIPTTAEVTAGSDLTTATAELNGFSFSNSPIPVPDMASTFTGNIPGEDTADESSIMFYEDTTTNTLQTTLAKGVSGYICIFFAGIAGANPAIGDKCEVWPVQSTGPFREYSVGNDPARWGVRFAMTAPPNFSATLT
jgi:hypothetical protein